MEMEDEGNRSDRSFGAIPSRPDHRDHPVQRYVAVDLEVLPPSFEATPRVPVYNQGPYGMCVAFTLAEVKECEEARERRTQVRWSPAFIYGNRCPTDWQGEGMEPREALNDLRRAGVCPWTTYPGIGAYPACKAGITAEIRRVALPQVIRSYARATNVAELKTGIYRTGPGMICIPVYESFMRPTASGIIPRVRPNEALLGFHAMMVYGWTSSGYWLIQNSWGPSWGAGGRCLLPLYYFPLAPAAQPQRRMEGWIIADALFRKA
jgi:hypothetical protein